MFTQKMRAIVAILIFSSFSSYAESADYQNNLLKNSGFEKESESWKGWPAGENTEISFDAETTYDGNKSLKIISQGDPWQGFKQRIPGQAGKLYTFSAWCKGKNVVLGRIELRFLDVKGKILKDICGVKKGACKGTFDWREISLSEIAPENTVEIECAVNLRLSKVGGSTLWWDGASLIVNKE